MLFLGMGKKDKQDLPDLSVNNWISPKFLQLFPEFKLCLLQYHLVQFLNSAINMKYPKNCRKIVEDRFKIVSNCYNPQRRYVTSPLHLRCA